MHAPRLLTSALIVSVTVTLTSGAQAQYQARVPGNAVAFDAAGRAYVAGQAGLIAYDDVGAMRWQRPFAVSGAAWTVAGFVGALPLDRIAVAGSGYFTGPGHEFALAVFDTSGNEHDGIVVGPPYAAAPSGFCLHGDQVFLHGGGSNGHDQDMLTAAFRVQ